MYPKNTHEREGCEALLAALRTSVEKRERRAEGGGRCMSCVKEFIQRRLDKVLHKNSTVLCVRYEGDRQTYFWWIFHNNSPSFSVDHSCFEFKHLSQTDAECEACRGVRARVHGRAEPASHTELNT
mgnify:CR=1 FL=1